MQVVGLLNIKKKRQEILELPNKYRPAAAIHCPRRSMPAAAFKDERI
ncbi:hypothetical protein HMPREF9141_1928 [Prevotella multiformis DSM 16608]|uniref:Uncharacterized protein n=1 Tax=Prevotella multiformis DSM 16608 TaxID=888743 RepID=F0F8L1_9BACT|nr:hypothetical protein HMPREF9141_1928 [Prevotella multiformis DSM 16608]